MSQRRVFTASFTQETNSFCIVKADLARFKAGGYFEGDEIPARFSGTRSGVGAVLDLADEFNWSLTHPIAANAAPSGPVTAHAYQHVTDILIRGLKEALPVDGVLLVLHGAMIADGVADAEADIISKVRQAVGPSIPIAVSFDLHGNVSATTASLCDIVSSYRTTPHVDSYETAERAGRILQSAMNGEISPKVAYAQGPLFYGLDAGRTISGEGPMVDILQLAEVARQDNPDLLDIAINAGFDWSDKACIGPSVLVTTKGDIESAQKAADELIEFAWKTRQTKTIELLSIEEVIRQAEVAPTGNGPLLIGDYTDCPGGGGNGDGTALLKALIESNVKDAVLSSIPDEQSVKACWEAGVGGTVSLQLGGKLDPRFGGGPLKVDAATVLALSDGNVTRKGAFSTGTVTSYGPSCLVQIRGVKVIIATHRVQIDDREQFRIFGIDPETTNVLACKAMNHFRADFEPISRKLLYVETGGVVSFNYKELPFKNVRRPVWPLDEVKA